MALHNQINIVGAIIPADANGIALNGQWISLKYYRQVTIVITQGGWAGGTPAVTLVQAKDVAGTDAKPLGFTKRWQQAWNTGATGYVESAVTGDTFNLPNTANQQHLLVIDAAMLDTDNGFDCLRVALASPGAFATQVTATYLLSGGRYADVKMPNALAN